MRKNIGQTVPTASKVVFSVIYFRCYFISISFGNLRTEIEISQKLGMR